METGSNAIEVLDEDECLALLGSAEVGRVGVVIDGQPLIFPVNHVLDAGGASSSTPIRRRCSRPPPRPRWPSRSTGSTPAPPAAGWSWPRASATTITDAVDTTSEHLQTVSVMPWAPGPKPRLLRIDVRTITGRRFAGA